jgi:hypothetical protein
MSKIAPTLGHSASQFNDRFLDEVCPSEFLRSRAASTGSLRECRFWTNDVAGPVKSDAAICGQKIRLFWATTCIFWTAIYGFVLWDRN